MGLAQSIVPPAPARAWHMYRAMVGVGLLCGLLIVTVFQLTRPVIERKKAEALRAAHTNPPDLMLPDMNG